MSNPFQPYTSEIVSRLIKMDHGESRAWFRAIREYIERFHRYPVVSIHDYITKPLPADNGHDTREIVLHDVVLALRANDIAQLTGTTGSAP